MWRSGRIWILIHVDDQCEFESTTYMKTKMRTTSRQQTSSDIWLKVNKNTAIIVRVYYYKFRIATFYSGYKMYALEQ